jgi:hypothetical protein
MKKEDKKKRTMRYTDAELDIIKQTFAENDDLLIAIRKHFLQMPLELQEQHMLNKLRENEAAMAVLRKTYLPTLDGNAPISQLIDLWMTVDLKDKSPEQAYPHLEARELLVTYLNQQLTFLESEEVLGEEEIQFEKLSGAVGKGAEQAYIDLVARNTLVSHNEQQLQMLSILAGRKEETVEETQKRLRRDSSM